MNTEENDLILKKRTLFLRILYITLTISLIAVWGQSCLSKEESTVSSDAVAGIISPVEEMKNGTPEEVWQYERLTAVVRKIAHVVEYCAVGFQIMCILYLWKRKRVRDYITCMYCGLTVAFIDETVQIFSSRGPLVSDLWIDLAGVCLGIGCAFLVRLIVIKVYQSKEYA